MNSLIYYPVLTENEKRYPFYITSLGLFWLEFSVDRPQGFPDYQFVFSVKGSGKLEINQKTYDIPSGSVMCLKANQAHSYHCDSREWITHWISFNGPGIAELFPYNEPVYLMPFAGKCEEIFSQIQAAKKNNTMITEGSVLLYRLLIYMRNSLHLEDPSSVLRKKLLPALQKLEQEFYLTPNLKDLAQLVGVTPEHFCRIFKTYTGMRPFEHLAKIRIQKAKELLLLEPDLPVKEISHRIGYENESYFGAQFKKYEKSSPKQFRELHRQS